MSRVNNWASAAASATAVIRGRISEYPLSSKTMNSDVNGARAAAAKTAAMPTTTYVPVGPTMLGSADSNPAPISAPERRADEQQRSERSALKRPSQSSARRRSA